MDDTFDDVPEPADVDPAELEPGDVEPADLEVADGVEAADGVDRAIEAIVMVGTEPVTAELLADLLDVTVVSVERRCTALAARYEEAGHGFQLIKVAGGWRFQSHPDQAGHVERYVLDGQSARLSGAALETLAIVAYKQPISRAQVASIRGVDPDGVMRTLQARGYIDQIGRDPGPGQAVLWGTTPAFLERLGLASIADLPALAAFVPGADVVEALEHGLRAPSAPAPATLPLPLHARHPDETDRTVAGDAGATDGEPVDGEPVDGEPVDG